MSRIAPVVFTRELEMECDGTPLVVEFELDTTLGPGEAEFAWRMRDEVEPVAAGVELQPIAFQSDLSKGLSILAVASDIACQLIVGERNHGSIVGWRLGAGLFGEFAEPDVAVTDRVAVVLQTQRQLGRGRFVGECLQP